MIVVSFCSLHSYLFTFLSSLKLSFPDKRQERRDEREGIYWLTLLKRTNLIEYNFDGLLSLAEEIKRMLIVSLNTAKENTK